MPGTLLKPFLWAVAAAREQPCTNEVFEVASQTWSGKQSMQMSSPPMVIDSKITQSMDMDAMNIVQWVEQNSSVLGKPLHTSLNQIINFKARTLTQRVAVNMAAPRCTTVPIPDWFPGPAAMQRFSRLMRTMQTCTEHLNGVDLYDLDFPPSWLPLSLPFSVHETVGLDKDGLLQSMVMKETINGNIITAHLEVANASLGGPSAEDLEVPSEWDCQLGEVPSMETLLQQLDHSSVGKVRSLVYALRAGFAQEDVAV